MAEQPFHLTDPTTLRAFSHPLRQRIMWELGVRDYARAADLAAALGIPANAISFHLRVLAKTGLVVEAPEHARDKRDRVWTMAHRTFEIEPHTAGFDEFIQSQLDWVRSTLTADHTEDSPNAHGEAIMAALLTKAEGQQLLDDVAELIRGYRTRGAEAAKENPGDPERIFHSMMFIIGNRFDQDAPGSK